MEARQWEAAILDWHLMDLSPSPPPSFTEFLYFWTVILEANSLLVPVCSLQQINIYSSVIYLLDCLLDRFCLDLFDRFFFNHAINSFVLWFKISFIIEIFNCSFCLFKSILLRRGVGKSPLPSLMICPCRIFKTNTWWKETKLTTQ